MADDKISLSVAVVEALAAWGAIEVQLRRLFGILADMDDSITGKISNKASAIFDTIIGFDTRVDVIDALMAEEGLQPLEYEMWNRCSLRLRKLYKKRHALAHFVFSAIPDAAGQTDVAKWDYQLSPFFTLRALIRGETKTLSTAQVTERRGHFEEINSAIGHFSQDATQRRGGPLYNLMPDPPLVARFRASATQILEERARKQQEPPEQTGG